MHKNNLEYTCIFGGGAIRGFAYIGALRALEEIGVTIKTLAGSSVGAIFAGLLAVGYTTQEIEEILLKINYDLFRDIQIGKTFGISKGEVFLEWLKELLEQKFYGENYQKGKNPPIKFSDIEKNLVIITTNLANFECKEFSNFKTPDVEIAYAIRISAGMPGLMQPIKAGNAILVDGDLQKSWPLWLLAPDLCKQKERILEFRLEGDYDVEKNGHIDFVNTVYSCVTSIATKFIVEKYAKKDKFDYLILNTGSTIIVNFNLNEEKRKELIQIGYDQTKEYFTTILKQKKKELLNYYNPVLTLLETLQTKIKQNKIMDVKNILGEFYMQYIQTISMYIEKTYLQELEHIKKLFLENYYTQKFFKTPRLKNSKALLHKIEKFKSEINERILELQSYNPS